MDFSEKMAEMALPEGKGLRALCRSYYEQARTEMPAAYLPQAVSEAEEKDASEELTPRGRTVVLTGSVYAREFLDALSANVGASGLRIAMSAQRRPCYRNRDVVPAFYLPGTPQAEREKPKLPIVGAQEAQERVLRLLSLLFRVLGEQGACPKEAMTDVRLLSLRVHAPAAVTGLGLCRVLTGRTQKEFAALLGIGVKAYRLREQGRVPLSEEMASVVCSLAGCRRERLLSDADVGWDAAECIWKTLLPDTRRWVAVCAALFLRMLCGADKNAE